MASKNRSSANQGSMRCSGHNKVDIQTPSSEDKTSESRRLAYLVCPLKGPFAAAYNNHVIGHRGTK